MHQSFLHLDKRCNRQRRSDRHAPQVPSILNSKVVNVQVGDDGMKQVEDEAMMGLKGAAGMDTSREAMHQVLGHERDLILARFEQAVLSKSCADELLFSMVQTMPIWSRLEKTLAPCGLSNRSSILGRG